MIICELFTITSTIIFELKNNEFNNAPVNGRRNMPNRWKTATTKHFKDKMYEMN